MGQLDLGFEEGVAAVLSGAEFSDDGLYRYLLWREWDQALPRVLWAMLNPSIASYEVNDPTITKCIGFSKRLGFGRLDVVNEFAWCATDPKELREVAEPIGADNWEYLQAERDLADLTVVAWGNQGSFLGRDKQVLDILRGPTGKREVWCLGVTKSGQPKHPGRIGYNTKLRLFR